ncbi:MAG: LssY C-terminal domain-containing protein [Bryobacteraceae bacterium]|nr:LssY C-terminal domain-containing protein [Bryobacteraceae bacterium]
MKAVRIYLSLVMMAGLGAAQERWEVTVDGRDRWKDTGIVVEAGDLLRFQATGKLKFTDARDENGPEGLPRGWRDLIAALPLNDHGRGALIGRVGDREAARPFLVGEQRESRMIVGGNLWLGTNQNRGSSAKGSYTVVIERLSRGNPGIQTFSGPLPAIRAEDWKKIPYRVVDPDGTEGDLVNFIMFGREDQIKNALLSMGWVMVDRTIKDTILRGALGTFSKQAYLTIPMSPLMVFDRVQDYGWAHSDPVMTVAERHHFRMWKAPFTDTLGGEVWVGAGTHDVGFDRDQRNGKITHRIDPNVDGERDYIGESLKLSGQVVKLELHEREKKITEAKTAHGQEIFSDGKLLLIYLKPDEADMSSGFGDVFCTVLAQNNPDGGKWGACGEYLQKAGKANVKLPELKNNYRLLVIPGIMNTCIADIPAYAQAREHLEKQYGFTSQILSVPNDGSESNAKLIAEHIVKEMSGEDKRPFIVLGYSKGAPDLQVMLATAPEARKHVAAFISVAGASGGSPIADSIPGMVEKYGGQTSRATCKGDMTQGMNSLRRDVRQRFLSTYPHPFVPTYSLPAILTEEQMKAGGALSTNAILSTHDRFHDGQVLKSDATIPESKYLGSALGDHLGVALAFDTAKGGPATFPRAALLEAALRFVMEDLEKEGKGSTVAPPAATAKPAEGSGWSQGWGQKP